MDLDRAIELNPGDPVALLRRGIAKSRVADFTGALDDLGRTRNQYEAEGNFEALADIDKHSDELRQKIAASG